MESLQRQRPRRRWASVRLIQLKMLLLKGHKLRVQLPRQARDSCEIKIVQKGKRERQRGVSSSVTGLGISSSSTTDLADVAAAAGSVNPSAVLFYQLYVPKLPDGPVRKTRPFLEQLMCKNDDFTKTGSIQT
jgi:hypothetical protein